MRYLENLNDTSVIKHGDSSETLRLSARNDNEPVTWSDGDAATIHVDQVGKQIPAKLVVGSNNVLVDSGDLADLAAGKYGLELWVTLKSGKTAIWPSDGSLEMTIDKNSDEITGDTVTTITLEDLEKRVDDKISEGLKNIKIDPSKIPSVDLSDYAKKSDVPQVVYDKDSHTLTVNGQAVSIPADVDLSNYATKSDLAKIDLTPYITASAADEKYAAKSDVPQIAYDSAKHTLTINGELVNLPASVDLSGYAKSSDLANYALKSSIPNVVLDVAKRSLSVNGASITIPQSVDLSQYAKSSDVPSVKFSQDTNTLTVDGTAVKIPEEVDLTPYAKSADVTKEIDQKLGSIPSVDLTDYVRKEDVADFVRKTDIKPVPEIKLDTDKRTLTVDGQNIDIPSAVDLSQYAKVDAVPSVALDAEKRTITINGTSINVPDTVNLDNYVTQSELTQKLATVSQGGKIDLTGYVTKADADATYAKKTDIAGMLTKTEADQDYAAKSDIKDVDLTPYAKTADIDKDFAKKSDVPSVTYDAEKKTLSVNGKTVELPENVDLSGYAKTTDVNSLFNTVTGTIPQIGWDAGSRMLDINGTGVVIPQNVDMSAYLKTADAEQTFAKKSDVPDVVLSRDSEHLWISGQDIPLGEYAKERDVQNAVQKLPKISANGDTLTFSIPAQGGSNIYTIDTSKLRGSGENVTYDSTNNVLHVGTKEIHPVLQSEIDSYMQKSAAETEFAKKSDMPTITRDEYNQKLVINGYDVNDVTYNRKLHEINIGNNTVDIPDTNNFAPLDWVNGNFARKDEVPDVSYDADKKQLTVNDKSIDLSGSDSSSAIWFKSDVVDTSITWTYNGHTAYQTPISSLTGKGGDAATKVNPGDVVIDGTGKAFTIYGTTSDSKAELIKIGSTAGKGIQAKNITDWNAYQGGEGTAPMQYIGKASIKDALQLDNSKTYTMDLDAGTLVNETDKTTQKMLPGVYQLRDLSTDVNNLTVKSDSSFGGNGGTPVQATVTPYEIDVVLVNGADVSKAWRSCWLADQSSWYGVTDKWHIEK